MKIFACLSLLMFLAYIPIAPTHANQKNLTSFLVTAESKNVLASKKIKPLKTYIKVLSCRFSLAELLFYQCISLALTLSLFYLNIN